MTLTQYIKSLSRRCSVLGLEPPSPSMAAAYRNAGYSPREAAGIELDEYIQYKNYLKSERSEHGKARSERYAQG